MVIYSGFTDLFMVISLGNVSLPEANISNFCFNIDDQPSLRLPFNHGISLGLKWDRSR
jgi:hypothetical protein